MNESSPFAAFVFWASDDWVFSVSVTLLMRAVRDRKPSGDRDHGGQTVLYFSFFMMLCANCAMDSFKKHVSFIVLPAIVEKLTSRRRHGRLVLIVDRTVDRCRRRRQEQATMITTLLIAKQGVVKT
jgi:hypothetical protein